MTPFDGRRLTEIGATLSDDNLFLILHVAVYILAVRHGAWPRDVLEEAWKQAPHGDAWTDDTAPYVDQILDEAPG